MKNAFLILRVLSAGILLQTLYFKFTAAPESVWIFETLGAEPFGRIASGFAELIAAVLLLMPRTAVFGALFSMGVMGGALLSHVFILGIEIQDDGGLLFGLALFVLFSSAIVVWNGRKDLEPMLNRFGIRLPF